MSGLSALLCIMLYSSFLWKLHQVLPRHSVSNNFDACRQVNSNEAIRLNDLCEVVSYTYCRMGKLIRSVSLSYGPKASGNITSQIRLWKQCLAPGI
ncbi:hypothetical protein L873DRAFT_1815460 [Choiromyces venosus 120613-1]|uniref:Secreted protein n=1 Tax=Choiromyces venosus 120613-1 TaxID=1336337 RepID=A0A3N4JBE8_9PEZI|nr:hypothetical protein L873DRAFT_1815460 [Choiromyces venosus 120613-1]